MPQNLGDNIKRVRLALINTQAVTARVGHRIYTSHRRDEDIPTTPSPFVILESRQRYNFRSSVLSEQRFWVYAYSNQSLDECRDVYNAVRTAINTSGLPPVAGPPPLPGVHCNEDTVDFETWIPTSNLWLVRSSWQMTTFG